jgi:hypothetical protein
MAWTDQHREPAVMCMHVRWSDESHYTGEELMAIP